MKFLELFAEPNNIVIHVWESLQLDAKCFFVYTLYTLWAPLDGGITVQGILMPMCNPLMATLVKGHLP